MNQGTGPVTVDVPSGRAFTLLLGGGDRGGVRCIDYDYAEITGLSQPGDVIGGVPVRRDYNVAPYCPEDCDRDAVQRLSFAAPAVRTRYEFTLRVEDLAGHVTWAPELVVRHGF